MAQASYPVVALWLTSTALQVEGQRNTAKQMQIDARLRRRQEKAAGKEAQIKRNEDMLNELARRRAVHGAGGGTGQGSLQNIEEREFELFEQDQAAIKAGVQLTSKQLSNRGRSARRTGNINMLSTVTKAGGSLI